MPLPKALPFDRRAGLISAVCLASALAGCGFGSVAVTGTVSTTEVYSTTLNANYGLPDPTCGSMSVQIQDGAGEILAVTTAEVIGENLKTPEQSVKTLECELGYEFSVDEAAVYTISLPKVDEASLIGGTIDRTVNREGKQVEVPPMDLMRKPLGF